MNNPMKRTIAISLAVFALALAVGAQTPDTPAQAALFREIRGIGQAIVQDTVHIPTEDRWNNWAAARQSVLHQRAAILDGNKQTERLLQIPLSSLSGSDQANVCLQFQWAHLFPWFRDMAVLDTDLLEFMERTPTLTVEKRREWMNLRQRQELLMKQDTKGPCK